MLLSNLHESDFHICDSYVKRKHSVWSKAKKHPHQGLSKCHHSSISSWISSSDSLRHQPNPLVTLNVVQRRKTHCTSTLQRHIISVISHVSTDDSLRNTPLSSHPLHLLRFWFRCVLHGRSHSLHMVLSLVLVNLCSPPKSPRFTGNQRQHCTALPLEAWYFIKRGPWWSMMIHDDPWWSWSCIARKTCTRWVPAWGMVPFWHQSCTSLRSSADSHLHSF